MRKIRPPISSLLGVRGAVFVIFATLILETVSFYYGGRFLVFNGFWYAWLVLFVAIPIGVVAVLARRFPWFLGWPRLKNNFVLLLVSVLGLLAVAGFFLVGSETYLTSYKQSDSGDYGGLRMFMLLTLATIPAWEFLHRSFLFGGVIHFLNQDRSFTSPAKNATLAACVGTCFEVVHHFSKPIEESAGLIIAAPFFYFLTYRTKSIWPALFIHMVVELQFAYFLFVA